MGFEVAELDRLEPGAGLVAALAAIGHDQLSAYDRVTVLKAHQRLASHFQTLAYEDMESIYSTSPSSTVAESARPPGDK